MAKTILLADDSVTIRKVVELTFMDEDYEVVAVANGDEALAQLDVLAPDIIIADIHMPGADGYEVARISKSKRPEVPVLLLVGTFEQFDPDEVAACGAEQFLKKPFDSQELLRMVDELLAAAPAAEPEPVDTEVESSFSFDDDAPPTQVAPPPVVEAEPPAEILEDESPFGEADDLSTEDTEPMEELASGSPYSPFGEPEMQEPTLSAPTEEFILEESAPEAVEEPAPMEAESISVDEEPVPMEAESVPEDDEPAASAFEPDDAGDLSEEDVDRIARRVVEYLTDDVVRDLGWEILPDLAEVIIKARLRELEGQVE